VKVIKEASLSTLGDVLLDKEAPVALACGFRATKRQKESYFRDNIAASLGLSAWHFRAKMGECSRKIRKWFVPNKEHQK